VGVFKSGGFRLAVECGVRIVPVAIVGTRDVARPGEYTIHRGRRVLLSVLPSVDPLSYGLDRVQELLGQVRAAIVDERERLKAMGACALPLGQA
jgi:1-acyl-sn-glycerol-3-phosphate acyltransferase